MKKIVLAFVMVIIVFHVSIQICSADNQMSSELLVESNEYHEIAEMKQAILEELNLILEIPRKITSEDLDFSKAVKRYFGEGLLNSSSLSAEELEALLNSNGNEWILPVYIENTTIFVSIGRQGANMDGSREVRSISIYDDGRYVNYLENLQKSLQDGDISAENLNFKLVIGIPNIIYPAFVGYDNEGVQYIIPAEESTAAVFDFDAYNSSQSKSADVKQVFEIYKYGDVYEASKNIQSEALDVQAVRGVKTLSVTPYSQNIYYPSIILLSILAGGMVIIYFIVFYRRKNYY